MVDLALFWGHDLGSGSTDVDGKEAMLWLKGTQVEKELTKDGQPILVSEEKKEASTCNNDFLRSKSWNIFMQCRRACGLDWTGRRLAWQDIYVHTRLFPLVPFLWTLITDCPWFQSPMRK